jgi:hypothetical protein
MWSLHYFLTRMVQLFTIRVDMLNTRIVVSIIILIICVPYMWRALGHPRVQLMRKPPRVPHSDFNETLYAALIFLNTSFLEDTLFKTSEICSVNYSR